MLDVKVFLVILNTRQAHRNAYHKKIKCLIIHIIKCTTYINDNDRIIDCYYLARQPLVGQGRLIVEASRLHSDTPHSVGLI